MTLTHKLKTIKNQHQGFTLIEVLLVVAIIAILAGIVILAINPTKQLGDTRNAQRQADVTTILNAAYQYSIDNQGQIPATITTTATDICSTGATCPNSPLTSPNLGAIDLSVLSANGKYLVSIPKDPSNGNAEDTGYQISQNANGRITVSAPHAEQGKTISVTR
jgi:prepilin-type N-terminal cleavage/methylation domain-containing protein